MTQGAAALVHPLELRNVHQLHLPLIGMLVALLLVIGLAAPRKVLNRKAATALLFIYGVFVFLVLRY